MQGNIAATYAVLGRREQALSMLKLVYSGNLKLYGPESEDTLREANNYATNLFGLNRHEEATALLRKTMPVARRVIGENHDITIRMSICYAMALYYHDGATLDDLHEAVATLEDAGRIARQVLGGAHPLTERIGISLPEARAALRARETPSSGEA